MALHMPDYQSAESTVILRADDLRILVQTIFEQAGCSETEATCVATHLVDADLRGHPSHGVARVARYVQWLQDDILRANQTITVEQDTDSFVLIEGNYGFGQSIGEQAVSIGIEKAQKNGVAVTALKNSGHLGCISDFAEQAALEGVASIHFVNVRGSLLVAPFGGREARGGTSPICCGIPGPDGVPVVLDFATSKVAEGKALVALRGGAKLPDDALIGPSGSSSGDPRLLYGETAESLYPRPGLGEGALTPFGLHKGSGLNFFAEVFAGALTGSGTAGASGEETRRKLCNGMLSIFLSVEHFQGDDWFANEVKAYIDFVKSATPIVPGEPVLIPGEKEIALKQERLASGIPITKGVWHDIQQAARFVGLSDADMTSVTKAGAQS